MYLFASIISATLFGISFKIIAIKKINAFQAIIVNYFVAGSLGFLMTNSGITPLTVFHQPWIYFGVGLGIVFISSLFVIAETTGKYGISVAQVAQRMSVVIPISLAILFYSDKITIFKIIGIVLAIMAVYFVSHKESGNKNADKYWWVFPLIIFVASGIIDSSINHVQGHLLKGNDLDVFLSTIFSTAFAFGSIVLLYQLIIKKNKFQWIALPAGVILGLINFSTMFFLANALGSGLLESSALFPINNLSILTLSTIVSVVVFKEKLSSKNWIGIGLSLLAIFMLGLLPQFIN
jgi:uncharacterized membrane protein